MMHRVKGNRLGRLSNHRRALLRNLAKSMVLDGTIRTTEAKAKALRPFLEKLVTRAKTDSLANRRVIAARLGPSCVGAVKKIFSEIGPRYKERKGGYLRIIKISGFRRGDGTRQAQVLWS